MNKILAKIFSYSLPLSIGAAVAIATGLFDFILHQVNQVWHNNVLASRLDIAPSWLRAAMPLLAIPFIIFVLRRIPGQRQHTYAEIIESIHINRGQFDLKSAWYSILGALISLSSGFSVGQYGPTVQQGSAVGYALSQSPWFRERHGHIFIAAGVAAAIAAIFHAPIAAVVFAHEVILRFFSTRAFAPITISAVTSYVISSEVFHRTTFLSGAHQVITSPFIYALVIILAIIAGIVGVAFIRTIIAIQMLSRRRHIALHYRVITAAFIMSCGAYFLPDIMGTSEYFLHAIINQYDMPINIIAVILLAKFVVTALCLGLGIPGGIFSPAIFMGALLGALVSHVLTLYFPGDDIQKGLLTITTMAAMASAIMGAPISMILIILEITDNFTLTSAVMLAVVMANITAYRLLGVNSFVGAQLQARGINLEVGRDLLYLKRRHIRHLISDQYISLHRDMPLDEAERLLLTKRQSSAYLVDDAEMYEGQISLMEIRDALREEGNGTRPIVDFANRDGDRLYHLSTIWEAIEMMGRFDGTHLPILDSPENPKLIGVLYESTLIKEYLNDMQHLRASEQGRR